MRAFLCHSSEHSNFVVAVAKCLNKVKKVLDGGVFCYEDGQNRDASFVEKINRELAECEAIVIFAGSELKEWQKREVNAALAMGGGMPPKRFVVCQVGTQTLPEGLELVGDAPRIFLPNNELVASEAKAVASQIVNSLKTLTEPTGMGPDGLPVNPHLFSYEKDIISHFTECAQLQYEGRPLPEKLKSKQKGGCPKRWPRVPRWTKPGQVKTGTDRQVVAAALSQFHHPVCVDDCVRGCMVQEGPSFLEAVRRKQGSLYFPNGPAGLNVGIVVSGGIAPGINAVIDGIVQRQELYATEGKYAGHLQIVGLRNGFLAFDDLARASCRLSGVMSAEHATEGGSFLGTSRDAALFGVFGEKKRLARLKSIVKKLRDNNYDILYVIGGDGSMKAAHALWVEAEKQWAAEGGQRLSVVAVPKTMDNDVLWVWQAFGFMSAVEKGREIIEQIGTEVASNPRLYVVQLFGSDSGFVVSHAVLASKGRLCDVALIPEIDFSMPKLADRMRTKIRERMQPPRAENPWALLPGGMVVMAETAIPKDALEYVDDEQIGLSAGEKEQIRKYCRMRDNGKRIQGQTDENLRSAGLKIVSRGVANLLQRTDPDEVVGDPVWRNLRVFTNEPRHQLRAIPPSCTDIIFGNRLGTLAVDNAMAGYTDFMISQWLTEYVLVPLQLVVLGRKRIPKEGMFWQSVMAKTGQDSLE
jgi:6-phosphofructokinase 1